MVLFVFFSAIGSSVASSLLTPVPGYTRKADVEGQVADCEQRGECQGTTRACQITFDHDDDINTPDITVDLHSNATGTCGAVLLKD